MVDQFRSQVREVINRNSFVTLALEQGFNAFLPVYDGGIDFLLYRESDGDIRKVQLKSRWSIDRKYIDRDIWIAFPHDSQWFLMKHDEMVDIAERSGYTKTASWVEGGIYNTSRPSKAVLERCAPYRFASLATVVAKAEEEAETLS